MTGCGVYILKLNFQYKEFFYRHLCVFKYQGGHLKAITHSCPIDHFVLLGLPGLWWKVNFNLAKDNGKKTFQLWFVDKFI